MPSQPELEDDMNNGNWCDKHPHDCARLQRQQDREWLHSHGVVSGPLDIVAPVVAIGLCILAML